MGMIIKSGWYFLVLAVAGEVLVPFILALFYKGYSHSKMVISLLGSRSSPVRLPFNLWMLSAGILFLLAVPVIYETYRDISKPLSLASVLFLAVFAVGACIFSCFFSVNDTKETITLASGIHGAGSVIGFMLLLFVPLFLAILSFKKGENLIGALAAVSFTLAVVCFVLFIMSDKPRFSSTWIAKEGLWQRLNLLFMYLPLACIAVKHIAVK